MSQNFPHDASIPAPKADPQAAPKKVFIETHGCQMNEYDSSRMVDLLRAHRGMVQVDRAEDADVLLLNTCSIREKAQEKVFHQLGRWNVLKKDKPGLKIAVGGCVASQEGAAIGKRAPYVDVVFGPQTLHRLPELLDESTGSKPVVDVSFPEIEKFDRLPEPQVASCQAYLTIQEGCSKYCAFCVVPYTRGEEISRPLDDVIAEAVHLAENGVSEINLLGQNVNAYRGPTHDGKTADLATLITLLAAIDGIERIRYTTSHPMEFTQSLIDCYATVPKLVSHLHLPIQAGSDRVLAMMKRNHTVLEYKSIIRKLRAIRPGMSISSDFIVGFPGETEDDFNATMKLIAEIGFDHSYSFIYSQRPGTPAAELADDTPDEVKKQRLALLQARIMQQTDAITNAMVGNVESCLVIGPSKQDPGLWQARTENNRSVFFPNAEAGLTGRIVRLTITAAQGAALRGERAN
ncbi:MAG: tRNA (N6-isopentenyl adenosine(37)-C2)-methylthiotransferase MiaB [Gammaproteobacteria bacterium]